MSSVPGQSALVTPLDTASPAHRRYRPATLPKLSVQSEPLRKGETRELATYVAAVLGGECSPRLGRA